MANLAIAVDVLARDRASGTLNHVGDSAENTGKRFSKLGAVAGGFLGGAAAAAVGKFGKDSVAAFKEAQQSSVALDAALAKFPATADVSRASLDKLNSSLAKKTTFDDDALASGQAVLAQFGLTGKQITQVTPLLADYAARTGKDVPEAARALGLALNGNARGLKMVGINLPKAADGAKALAKAQREEATSGTQLEKARRKLADIQQLLGAKGKTNVADAIRLRNAQLAVKDATEKHKGAAERLAAAQANAGKSGDTFSKVMDGLRTKVGGFAEKEGKTAAGQSEILANQWGEIQETVGAKLVPALSKLAGWLLKIIDFVQRNGKVIGPLVAVAASLATAVWAINAAARAWTATQVALNIVLSANPIGVVVLALAALVTGFVLAWKHSETFRDIVKGAFASLLAPVQLFLKTIGFMLSALGHIPGFGWAKTAAKAVNGLADKVGALRDKLTNLPKNTNLKVTTTFVTIGKGHLANKPLPIDGKRALGGPVHAGNYLVGERGPEILSIGASGFVTPNNQIGGKGLTVEHLEVHAAPGEQAGQSVPRALTALAFRMGF